MQGQWFILNYRIILLYIFLSVERFDVDLFLKLQNYTCSFMWPFGLMTDLEILNTDISKCFCCSPDALGCFCGCRCSQLNHRYEWLVTFDISLLCACIIFAFDMSSCFHCVL